MISAISQYELRVVMALAMLGRGLARRTEIPSNYLSKVLLALRDMGLLTKARGSGVGYRLQKCPKEIHLVNVVTVFDATQIDPPCLLGQKECSDEDPYTAHVARCEVGVHPASRDDDYRGYGRTELPGYVGGLKMSFDLAAWRSAKMKNPARRGVANAAVVVLVLWLARGPGDRRFLSAQL